MQSEEEEEEEEISALQREVLDEEQLVEEEQVAMEEGEEEEGVEEESILVQDKWLLFQLQTMMHCLKLETIENVGGRKRARKKRFEPLISLSISARFYIRTSTIQVIRFYFVLAYINTHPYQR